MLRRTAFILVLSLAVAMPGLAQQQTPKQALAQGQLNGLMEAQSALMAADQAGAQQYAKSLYDDAQWRLNFAQNNWNAAKGSMREQAKLRAEEGLWAARAALAKARWLGTNAALRGLQADVVRLGGPTTSMTLMDEPPTVDISRGTNSRDRIKYAQALIDTAKAAGAEMVEGNDLKPAQENLDTARKLTRNDSTVESADHLAYDAEMMARRALYLVRMNQSSKYLPDLQMTRTRLAQAEADRMADQERQQRQMAEQHAAELQRQLLNEQANRAAQSAEVDRLRAQVDESRRQLEQQLAADKAARAAAEQALDAAFSKYESAVKAGTSSDVEGLRRQLEDQQLTLRGIQQRELLNEQQMAAEIAGLQTSLQGAQQQGTINAQVLAERQAELTRRQQELDQLKADREADMNRRAELDRQRDQAIADATSRRAEAEAQAQALQAQVAQAQQQAQISAAAAQSANEELERTKQQLAQRDSDVRRVQMEAELAKFGNTRNDNGRFIVALSGGLLFDTGKSTLKPGAKATLSKIATELQSDQSIRISVEGHTDSVGSEELNQTLSERRAAAVRDYLVSQGVPEDRITSDGQGEAQPIATNKTAAGRQQNRRVELVITR